MTPEGSQLAKPPPRTTRAYSRRLYWSAGLGAAVFAAFAAYAYLAPATYETQAAVQLQVSDSGTKDLPAPAEASQHLQNAILTPRTLTQLANQNKIESPDRRLEFAQRLRNGIIVSSADAKNYRITCQAPDADLTQSICNQLAESATKALTTLIAKPHESAEDAKRKKKLEELLAFVAAHPEASQTTKPEDEQKPEQPRHTVANDPLLATLNTERATAAKQLSELEAVDPSNPYADNIGQEIVAARSRLAAVDRAIVDRQAALKRQAEPKAPETKPTGEINEKLAAMLKELAESASRDSETHRDVTAKITQKAGLPTAPIRPNRPLILMLGAIAALGVMISGFGVALAAKRPRKRGRGEPEPGQASKVETAMATKPAAAASAESPEPAIAPAAPQAADARPDNARQSGTPPAAAETMAIQVHRDAHSDTPHLANVPSSDVSASGKARPEPKYAPPATPQTQLGGFDSPKDDKQPALANQASRQGGSRARKSGPISVKGLVAVEAGPAPAEEAEASERDSRQRQAYTPPKRNITRRLGSPIWVTDAPGGRSSSSSNSTRYSYVSSRPPAPDAGAEPGPSIPPAPKVIDTMAEDVTEPAKGGPMLRGALERHPVSAGWQVNPQLSQETCKAVCDALLMRAVDGCQVVGITSIAAFGREKSRAAACIATGLGLRSEPHVLLVEGDFQAPKVHRNLRVDMPMATGFSQQLQRRGAAHADQPWHVVNCLSHLDVLAEGIIRSPGAILSAHFERCIHDLRNRYDIILIDGPPTSNNAEGRAFADVVDGVVVCTPASAPELPGLATTLFQSKRFVLPHTFG